MKYLFVAVLMLSVPAYGADDWKVDTAWIVAGQGADLAYTEYALRNVPGAYEANPLLRDQAVRLAVKAAVMAGGSALCHHYRKKGEHKKAKAVRWILFGAGIVAVSISAYQIHAVRER
jgi:hypothetical protein